MSARDRRRMDVRFEVFARMPEEIKANIQLVCEAMLKVEDIKALRADADGATAVVVRIVYFAERHFPIGER